MDGNFRNDIEIGLDPADRQAWAERFLEVRRATEALAGGLSPEDQAIQSMPDVSPTKWHLAHTSWFFETFLLVPQLRGYEVFHPAFGYLFNSYYEAVGPRHPRAQRGLLSRPSVAEIAVYRDAVTEAMVRLIGAADAETWPIIFPLLELGIHHEQQHQELILMDIKHVFFANPLRPHYQTPRGPTAESHKPPAERIEFPGGLVEIGYSGSRFAFDNERPRHRTWLEPYRLASRLVTCGEFLSFIDDGGYRRPELWLSDGWAAVEKEGWGAPLYWERNPEGKWGVFTLSGMTALNESEPVCHVSCYEADAFARWSGKRLPIEAEWEIAAADVSPRGNLADSGIFHPVAAPAQGGALQQMIGDVWEWTMSAYGPYPGFRAADGAIGEYNGKFMSGQMVLRGAAAVTPPGHVRISYRNFFPPSARWAFSGLRLADGP
ncbi:MAG: ergothioneine biosynthesis protein EgtB [Alphaproteobacteria bacterium]